VRIKKDDPKTKGVSYVAVWGKIIETTGYWTLHVSVHREVYIKDI
jgi:hypothetical protein